MFHLKLKEQTTPEQKNTGNVRNDQIVCVCVCVCVCGVCTGEV